MRIVLSVFLVFAIAAISGCSISQSSGSISDSLSSPSKSSSDSSKSSSGGDDEPAEEPEAPEAPDDTARYEADVSQLAVTYAKSGGEIGAFQTAVSQLAMDRGITNWEADSETSQAIGRGVGFAGMKEDSFTAFSKQLYGDDLNKLNELRKGYQQTARPTAESTPAAPAELPAQPGPATS